MPEKEIVYYRSKSVRVTVHAVEVGGTVIPVFAISRVSAWERHNSRVQKAVGAVFVPIGAILLLVGVGSAIVTPLGHSAADEAGIPILFGGVMLVVGIICLITFKSVTTFHVGISTHAGEVQTIGFRTKNDQQNFKNLVGELLAYRTGGPPPQVRTIPSPPRAKSLMR